MAQAECQHANSLSSSRLKGFFASKKSFGQCEECGDNSDAWLCLHCAAVYCSRSVQGHMIKHSQGAKHAIVMGLNTRQIWCYECEEDVDRLVETGTSGRKRERVAGQIVDIRKFVGTKVQNTPGSASIDVSSTLQVQSPRSPPSLPSFPSSPIHILIEPPIEEERKPTSRTTPKPKGLSNLGNTCYFNSILQCLCASQTLHTHLPDLQTLKKSSEVNRAFGRSLQDMKEKDRGRVHAPSELLAAVAAKFKQFRGYGQHDSHELLRCLLEALAVEMKKAKTGNYVESVFGGQLLSSVLCIGCQRTGRGGMVRTTDPVMDISLEIALKPAKQPEELREFLSHWRYNIEAEDFAAGQSTNFIGEEPELPSNSDNSPTVESCLRAFTRCEGLFDRNNLYDCLHCHSQNPAIRRLLLYRPPKALALHLKRFTNRGAAPSKLKGFVPYPAVLDLSPYCVKQPGTTLPPYRLYAVSVHIGGLESGHYVAYIEFEGNWYECDDSQVSRVSRETALTQDAYLLFYQADEDLEASTHDSETSR